MEQYDVVVVGAGPSGSAAARKCVDNGLKTLLIDRKKLPRRKACSGIIANVSQNYILENFGPLPVRVYANPAASRGMAFYFPSVGPVFVDANCYSLYVWRDRFDHWLAKASGADLQDQTRFTGLAQTKTGVEVSLKQRGTTVKVRAQYLIGADGGRSKVITSFAPDVYQGLPWAYACQKYFEGTVDADDRYLYWVLEKGMGPFPWLNIKNGQIIVGLANVHGQPFQANFARYLDFLKRNMGLSIKKELATEGCVANMMTPMNRFFPGRGRVLMVGDAMGLMHQGGEGISCGLVSGGYAGQAIAQGLRLGRDPLPLYTAMVKPEMVTALDQFNPFRMSSTAASDICRHPGIFQGVSRVDRARMWKEMGAFVFKEFSAVRGIVPSMLKNTAHRSLLKSYKVGVMK